MAEKHLRPDLQAGRMLGFWPISPLLDTLWGSVLGAAFSILTLWDWNLWTCSLSVVPVAALLVVYSTFMPIAVKDYHFPLLNLEEAIVPLSLRVLLLSGFVLGIQAVAFGLPTDGIILTLSLGFTKALSWYFMTRIVSTILFIITKSVILTGSIGSIHILVNRRLHYNFQHLIHSKSIYAILRTSGFVTRHCFFPRP